MAHETLSPPLNRDERCRSPSEKGRGAGASPSPGKFGAISRNSPPRGVGRSVSSSEDERDRQQPHRRSRRRRRSRSGDRYSRNGLRRDQDNNLAKLQRRAESRSQERQPRRRSRQERPRERVKDTSRTSIRLQGDSSPMERERDASRKPYSKPRARLHSRSRSRSRDRRNDHSRERRDRSRDRRRNRSPSPSRSRERRRKRPRSRSRDRFRKSHRSQSPLPYRPLHKRRSRSPFDRSPRRRSRSPKRRKRSPSRSKSPSPHHRPRKSLPSQEVSFRGLDNSAQPPTKYGGAPPDREKPNFKPTGLLAKEANLVAGTKISLKYHEPPEARKPPPSAPWRLFIFKGDDMLETVELHTRSCWLLGRAHEVADIVLAHPTSSSQHAVIQFRHIQKTVEDEYGVKQKKGKVKPYIIDLKSSNGTELNGEKIETSRYIELRDKDILKFAGSEREYVIMLPPKEVTG
ncbi:hypothetical protein CC78DRAFT_533947 [Lojkania enalia]|uniref:FHA domain-containing protein n=1 Tax=Lojkania enalia TaxID=147567 RepID=A0A9P4N3F4_9PLEO|nr:hypothetical protein CC78DRAFT_533947 [Didymosphaeria enalia]